MKAKVPKVHPKKPTIQPWKRQRKRKGEKESVDFCEQNYFLVKVPDEPHCDTFFPCNNIKCPPSPGVQGMFLFFIFLPSYNLTWLF